jgi:hypothetical protein
MTSSVVAALPGSAVRLSLRRIRRFTEAPPHQIRWILIWATRPSHFTNNDLQMMKQPEKEGRRINTVVARPK